MFVLHEQSRLLKSSGGHVSAHETKIGMRLINGFGKSVEVVDAVNTHVPLRANNKQAFHKMKHLGWPTQIQVYDKNPILTDRGLCHITNVDALTPTPTPNVLCPSHIDWDVTITSHVPETFDMGFVLGAYYAGNKQTDPEDISDGRPILRAYNHHHMARLIYHVEAVLHALTSITTPDIDAKTNRIALPRDIASLFHNVQHSLDFPEKYIATKNASYAYGLYMGMLLQMKASGIVHENIYRALVLALILSKKMREEGSHPNPNVNPDLDLSATHVQFPLSSLVHNDVHSSSSRVRMARVLKLDDPHQGLLCDNMVLFPACHEIAFTLNPKST